MFLIGAGLAATFFWAYWPTLVLLVDTWNKEPDYSHGFLVVPIALYFLWARRDRMPKLASQPDWRGLWLIGVSILIRALGGIYYIDALDGWSIPFWVAGICWVFGGRAFCLWAAPAAIFLFFMVPLPWKAEHLLSRPLQSIATSLSCWMLQCLGQPALAEGNTIQLEGHQLEVEQACSGLRMFVSFMALGMAYAVLVDRPRWQKVLVFLAVLPIALVSNAVRITITGLLFRYVGTDAGRAFSHDAAGWVMIPFAAALFGLLLWYLSKLVIEAETVSPKELMRRDNLSPG